MKKIVLGFFFLFGFITLYLLWPLAIPQETKWTFYDRKGAILYSEQSYDASFETDLSDFMPWVLAVEDQRFISHKGVDLKSAARAFYQNQVEDRIVSGASTLTMQLVRQSYLQNKVRNWRYKIRQVLLAFRLEWQYTKQEIFHHYARSVYLGKGVFGFQQASVFYFSKPIEALSIGEKALLIGILPRPEGWNPLDHPEKAKKRRNLVLDVWKKKELITSEESDYWKQQPVLTQLAAPSDITAPHFIYWIKAQLREVLPKDKQQLHVYTTLDKDWYHQVLNMSRDMIPDKEQRNISNSGVVILDKDTNIRVMLGSVDFFDREIEGAVNITTSQREMGSTLKPFLFALALEQGRSPLTTVKDLRQSFIEEEGAYAPRNYNPHIEHGHVRYREALAGSYNIGAVDLLSEMGVNAFYSFLQTLGFRISQTPQEVGLALVLGSGESRLLDLTRGFSTFLKRGELAPARFFTTIKDEQENVLLEADAYFPKAKTVLQPSTAEWILHALSDKTSRWSNFPQGNALELNFPVAVKTGTSQDFRDNYVVGTSTDYTVGVWVGNTDGTPMRASSGLSGAGPLWHTILRMLHPQGAGEFDWQSNRKEITVCQNAWEDSKTCSETLNEFVLDTDQSGAISKPQISIAFPAQGDRFHPQSKITIKVRDEKPKPYDVFLDDQPASNILHSLKSGRHTISVTQDEASDTIEIFVEKE